MVLLSSLYGHFTADDQPTKKNSQPDKAPIVTDYPEYAGSGLEKSRHHLRLENLDTVVTERCLRRPKKERNIHIDRKSEDDCQAYLTLINQRINHRYFKRL